MKKYTTLVILLIILSLITYNVIDKSNKIQKDCRNLKTGEYKSIYVSDTCKTWDTITYQRQSYVVLKTTWQEE